MINIIFRVFRCNKHVPLTLAYISYVRPILDDLWNVLPVELRTNVNYSYFKSNLLLLIRKN